MLPANVPPIGTKPRLGPQFTVSLVQYLLQQTDRSITLIYETHGVGGMGIICSCLPTLWPLMLKAVSKAVSKAVPRSLFRGRESRSGKSSNTSLRSWWRAYKHSHGWSLSTLLGSTSTRQSRQKCATPLFVQGQQPFGDDGARRSDTEIPMLPIHAAHIDVASAVPDHGLLSRPSNGTQQVRIWSSPAQTCAQGSDEQPSEGICVDRTFSRTSQKDA